MLLNKIYDQVAILNHHYISFLLIKSFPQLQRKIKNKVKTKYITDLHCLQSVILKVNLDSSHRVKVYSTLSWQRSL